MVEDYLPRGQRHKERWRSGMQIVEMISQLQALQAAHGDIPVWLHDPDTGWVMDITLACTTAMDDYGSDAPGPLHVAIESSYTDERYRVPDAVRKKA